MPLKSEVPGLGAGATKGDLHECGTVQPAQMSAAPDHDPRTQFRPVCIDLQLMYTVSEWQDVVTHEALISFAVLLWSGIPDGTEFRDDDLDVTIEDGQVLCISVRWQKAMSNTHILMHDWLHGLRNKELIQ